MSNFDDAGLYYQERFFANDGVPDAGREMIAEYRQICEQFRRFIREFSTGGVGGLHYRDELKKNYNAKHYFLEVNLGHLKQFDEDAESKLRTYPGKFLPAFEEAARTVADELTAPRPEGEEEIKDIQISLTLDEYPTSIRRVKSAQVSQVVKISGIIVAASQVRAKATKITLQCRTCRHTISDQVLKPGLEGFQLPRSCGAPQSGQLQRCPVDPYHIVPDKCHCVDYQTLKLQENPEDVPHGEMPRHLQLYCDRYLTDKVAPGNRVTLVGVFSIKKLFQKNKGNKDKTLTGIRTPYLRVLGIHVETGGPGRAEFKQFTPDEERNFKELAKRPDAYELIAKSIAPSIYGSTDIKKSIACLLFGGSRKRLPDGLTRRGDINVLLLGDPGTAKSQLLKFVEQVSPIGVYTSGKGSSAAGLTASVVRDPTSRTFMMEGGAMVLADGGVVCIDEFDKMREDDRVAIHEAMEQQTISIAKAGITTTLNSRCSVLAAANSVYGRWDDSRGDENIDFMPTILSRFDMIYIVKDTHDVKRDETLARHVIDVHVNASKHKDKTAIEKEGTANEKTEMFDADGFLTLGFLKKYVCYARANCGPRLNPQASEKLASNYVRMRNPPADSDEMSEFPKITCKISSIIRFLGLGKKAAKSSISITVRQLEAVIRMSESLAKMELQPFALDKHVDEALRLFRVSTVEAAATGNLAGIEGFTSDADQESMQRIESQMKKRFSVGTHVSELVIVQDFVTRQHYNETLVKKVIMNMVRRGDLQYKMQRKMLYRVR
ncbi:MCM2/3/5 family protein [Ancylostoma caninum]|uniref:DNA replication licensing factor MCM5 n=1 Tax=Ancylostoma caninum TaxID=29170 RepID=A0A368G1P7_ANCCA|nr:MCM2/3/5 family protein [Ancylostoma caninum]